MNHAQVRFAYEEDTAARVISTIQNRFFLMGASVYRTGDGSFVASINERSCDMLEDIYLSLSMGAVLIDGTKILPVVSVAMIEPSTIGSYKVSSMVSNALCVGAALKPAQLNHKWRAMYERDMNICVELVTRLDARQATLHRQPVRSMATRSALYEEVFLRFEGKGGVPLLSFAECVKAIKNIGIQKVIDMYVLSSVLDQLERETSTSIGCNLSASSFILDTLWARTIKRLTSNPALARRLVIELTEEEPLDDLESALLFIEKLRELGCRFALDDLGAGMSRTTVIERGNFEYIKIDKSLLHAARNNSAGKKMLKHTVEYCGLFSKEIIVEGMETINDLNQVMKLGVSGGQGYYFHADAKRINFPVTYSGLQKAVFTWVSNAG
jgi:EAL domain-containing protein (putative c-di-GMP-specific phosphodiesterase class I)